MKQNVHRWRAFTPQIDAVDARHLLGFHNMTTGQLLCPCDLNWDDLRCLSFIFPIALSSDNYISSIQQSLQDGTRKVQPQDFPLFLWKNEKVSSTDFFDGFMQGDMVLKVYPCRCLRTPVYDLFLLQSFLHIFIGPSATHSSASGRSTRKGNAALHGIWTVSIYSIGYAATIVSVCLLIISTSISWKKSVYSFVSSSRTRAFSARAGWPRAAGHTKNFMMQSLVQWRIWRRMISGTYWAGGKSTWSFLSFLLHV